MHKRILTYIETNTIYMTNNLVLEKAIPHPMLLLYYVINSMKP